MVKANVMKVVELGLEHRVYDAMKKKGFSVESLTRELNDDGVQITAQSIRKFIKSTKKAQRQLIQQDLSLANEIKELTMDYNKAIRSILEEVQEVKNQAKDEKDYATYNQLIGRLMQGIELIAKLTGDLKPKGTIDINIIYNEISSDIEKKMRQNPKKFRMPEIIDIDGIIEEEDDEQARVIRGED